MIPTKLRRVTKNGKRCALQGLGAEAGLGSLGCSLIPVNFLRPNFKWECCNVNVSPYIRRCYSIQSTLLQLGD